MKKHTKHNILNPANDTLDPEERHLANRKTLYESPPIEIEKLGYKQKRFTDTRLHVQFENVKLDNPLIVAAGWDKFGESVFGLHALGFAGVEVGSILADPQIGNPKPRHFVLAHGVILQRYGFNTPGVDVVLKNLKKYKNSTIPLGISIGKNKDISVEDAPEAYAKVAQKTYDYASYFVVNVSSPNTPGLRVLQDKKPLNDIVKAVKSVVQKMGGKKSIFVKIAPDLTFSAIDDVIQVVIDNGLTGIIAVNTSLSGDLKAKYGEKWRNEMGGVSGDDTDYRKMATDIIRHLYKQAGKNITIIGAGGIKDTTTALEKIMAGATAVQILSALQYEGPELPGKINSGLVDYLSKNGVKKIQDLVGTTVK